MTTPLTYLGFLLLFVVSQVTVLALLALVPHREFVPRAYRVGIPVLVGIAVVYTAPWDTYLVARGVWTYGPGATTLLLAGVPVEEYLFVVLQTTFVGLLLSLLPGPSPSPPYWRVRLRLLGAVPAVAVGAAGLWLLTVPGGFYLGAILAWAAPVLAIQWTFGWPLVVANLRTIVPGVLLPTVYLAAADRLAIGLGIWTFSERYTTGLRVGGIPVEEIAFFFVTTLFVVQGLFMFRWVVERYGDDAGYRELAGRLAAAGARRIGR